MMMSWEERVQSFSIPSLRRKSSSACPLDWQSFALNTFSGIETEKGKFAYRSGREWVQRQCFSFLDYIQTWWGSPRKWSGLMTKRDQRKGKSSKQDPFNFQRFFLLKIDEKNVLFGFFSQKRVTFSQGVEFCLLSSVRTLNVTTLWKICEH